MGGIILNTLNITTDEAYKACRSDTSVWQAIINNVLDHHNIDCNTSNITAGFNSTYPVFLVDNTVIKFFGYRNNSHETYLNEIEAHHCLLKNTQIQAPNIIANRELQATTGEPWSYIISSKLVGQSWLDSSLTRDEQILIVSQLGKQLKHIHALPLSDSLKTDRDWGSLDIQAGAKKSVLPNHLIEQVPNFLMKLDPFDKVITHGDLVGMHLFIDDKNLSGIIDWGDATITDRHYELGKLTNLFPGDKTLLRTLLDAANWPVTKNFANQSLGLALYRQAVGLTQHFTFDVFYQLPDLLPLNEIKTLEELADTLFAV